MTPRQKRFVAEYLVDLNATQAAKRAGYSERTAQEQSSRLLSNVMVAEAIRVAQADLAKKTQVTAEMVLDRLWKIATADPNELVEFRRTCCRCCYGDSNQYQRTDDEFAKAKAEHAAARRKFEKSKKAKDNPGLFNEAGGGGYDARRSPNVDCKQCFGDGVGTAMPKDTRTLSPAARALYAGVKQTKDGVEVKMHDQATALVNVGRHLGMFLDRQEVSGKDGGPVLVKVLKGVSMDDL